MIIDFDKQYSKSTIPKYCSLCCDSLHTPKFSDSEKMANEGHYYLSCNNCNYYIMISFFELVQVGLFVNLFENNIILMGDGYYFDGDHDDKLSLIHKQKDYNLKNIINNLIKLSKSQTIKLLL